MVTHYNLAEIHENRSDPVLEARLHDFDSGVAEDLNMIGVPPAPTAITCKPLFFDTASRGLNLPGGFLSAVGGFFS